MRTKIFTLLSLTVLGAWLTSANAQIEKNEAAYIFNFTRFIKWPDSQTTGDFVIGVLGKSQAITNELKASASSRSVGSQSVKIVEFASADMIQNCHILFVPDDYSSQLKKAHAKLVSSAAVIITEEDGWNPDESTINLMVVDQKLAFHINKANADAKKLVISEKLMTLSK